MVKGERNKTQEKQVMHNTVAHHLLTKVIGSSQPTLTHTKVYFLIMMLYDMDYPFGKFSVPAHCQSMGNQKVLDLEQALLNKNYNISVLST